MHTAFILKHPVVAPQADSVRRRRAPLKPSTRLICANDKPFVMRDADAVIVLGTVPNIDSRRRVERNLPAPARRADHSVCAGDHPRMEHHGKDPCHRCAGSDCCSSANVRHTKDVTIVDADTITVEELVPRATVLIGIRVFAALAILHVRSSHCVGSAQGSRIVVLVQSRNSAGHFHTRQLRTPSTLHL